MSIIETIIFDMDGVIIDSEPIHMMIERELFNEFGLKVSEKEHQSYVGASSNQLWSAMVKKESLNISPQKLSDLKDKRYLEYLKKVKLLNPMAGVKEVIEQLHKAKMGLAIASSASRIEIEYILKKLELRSYFTCMVSGAELERSKPDPEIFLRVSSLIKTSPEKCCVVEDSRNGVLAAKSAGMKCIGFKNPNSGNQDLSRSDVILDSFNIEKFEKIIRDFSH